MAAAVSTPPRVRNQDDFVGIPSLYNFRPVDTICSTGNGPKQLLFRSSRPDLITQEELDGFKALGIRCIVDLRSNTEFSKASGNKNLQTRGFYETFVVNLPKGRKYKYGEQVSFRSQKNSSSADDADLAHKHILINFFQSSYLTTIISRAPWYVILLSVFVLLFDFIFQTEYIYFVRLYGYYVVNPGGLVSSYIDIVEMSQNSICAALKLLTEKENLPALINCAHGKDRTGIMSALILSLLGETKENIIADYVASEKGLEPIQQRVYDEVIRKYKWHESFIQAKPETMRTVLEYLQNKYGSVEYYLESLGFSQADQQRLRENLGYGLPESLSSSHPE